MQRMNQSFILVKKKVPINLPAYVINERDSNCSRYPPTQTMCNLAGRGYPITPQLLCSAFKSRLTCTKANLTPTPPNLDNGFTVYFLFACIKLFISASAL